jgi:hypothetical protein
VLFFVRPAGKGSAAVAVIALQIRNPQSHRLSPDRHPSALPQQLNNATGHS